MPFFRKTRSAAVLKKKLYLSDFIIYENIPEQESETGDQNNDYSGISFEIEDTGDDKTSHRSMLNDEDGFITRLYRGVIDDIMDINHINESQIYVAITEMKKTIHQGHLNKFRHFDGIDFCKPSNRCGYLIRYAMCHTGLVRESLEQFFRKETLISKISREKILDTNHLKVVSLGGGPGNDLVGFCSALNKTVNCVKTLDLTIVDISKGWESVFPSIVKKAISADFGKFSEILKSIEVTTYFAQADLNADGIFEDETLSSFLGEANLVLMVKLVSFMPQHKAENLIQNVVRAMQVGAQLIIIDIPFHKKCFERISCLHSVHHHYLKYRICFNPLNCGGRLIYSSQARIGVYYKFNNSSYENSFSEQYRDSFPDYDEDYISEDSFPDDDEDYSEQCGDSFLDNDENYGPEQYGDYFSDYDEDYASGQYEDYFPDYDEYYVSEQYGDCFPDYDEDYAPERWCGDSFPDCDEDYVSDQCGDSFSDYDEHYVSEQCGDSYPDYEEDYVSEQCGDYFSDYEEDYVSEQDEDYFSDYDKDYASEQYEDYFHDYDEHYVSEQYGDYFPDYDEDYVPERLCGDSIPDCDEDYVPDQCQYPRGDCQCGDSFSDCDEHYVSGKYGDYFPDYYKDYDSEGYDDVYIPGSDEEYEDVYIRDYDDYS